MPIGDICVRDVVTATRDTTIQQAAQLMRENHVGDLLVLETNGKRRPIGIVTDRDIVADEMTELAKLISREQRREMHARQ